jgi:hypothetical protein
VVEIGLTSESTGRVIMDNAYTRFIFFIFLLL